MPCGVGGGRSKQEHLEYLLCRSCRLMTKDQIILVDAVDYHPNLFKWYVCHLIDDFTCHVDVDKSVSEALRMGFRLYRDPEFNVRHSIITADV